MNQSKSVTSKLTAIALGLVLVCAIVFAAAPRAFADDFFGDLGSDSFSGDMGSDSFAGDMGNDSFYGDMGNDSFYGDMGNDSFSGDLGSDSFAGDMGNDSFYGDMGNDSFYGDMGNDSFYGDMGYNEECGCYESQQQQQSFGQQSSGGRSGQQSFGQQAAQQAMRVSAPGFSAPSFSSPSYSTPSYPQQPPQIRPVPQSPSSNVTNNTCTNGSCNSSTVNTNNSINGSFNTTSLTPVYQTPVQYPVQYVFPQQPQQNLFCTITANQNSVQNGQASYLSWSSSGASRAWLSDGIGNVNVNGSLSVRPSVSTSYTLTVSDNFGRTQICSTYVAVNGVSVSLSQIPYTGLDFGTLGNIIYWTALLAFAGAGAYLAIYFIPSMKLGAVGAALPKLAIAKSAPVIAASASIAAPALFAAKRPSSAVVSPIQMTRTRAELPRESRETSYTLGAAKDSMNFQSSTSSNEAPRITITRS